MTGRLAWGLLVLQLLALLVGTQMPGAWRSDAMQVLHAPDWVSSLGHFVLFAGMAMVLAARPLGSIVLGALALAFLTEGLQFIALDRHPRLRDLGIDMAGVVVALALVKGRSLCTAPQ
ncbi:VanZ family protein [Polaromonas sp.]|uniref:VanZ family protein n=1 Tax=Polaromonas sp. TaxID=1869339 RepID=UPI003BB6BFF7